MVYLVDEGRREYLRALPGWRPWAEYRVRHTPWESAYSVGAGGLRVETAVYAMEDALRFRVEIRNLTQDAAGNFDDTVHGLAYGRGRFRRGEDPRPGTGTGRCLPQGPLAWPIWPPPGAGWKPVPGRTALPGPGRRALSPTGLTAQGDGGCALRVRTEIPGGESARVEFALGWADSMQKACAEARKWAQPARRRNDRRPERPGRISRAEWY